MKQLVFAFLFIFCQIQLVGQNGYKLWLDYQKLDENIIATEYSFISGIHLLNDNNDEILNTTKNILTEHLSTLLDKKIISENNQKAGQITISINPDAKDINAEGFKITSNSNALKIESKTSKGLLYGAYYLINKMHRKEKIKNINISESPKIQNRILNHWDNIDRTFERGYAGFSILNWHELPEYLDPRYEDYAKANASIGINGTVLTNVNANAIVLRADYLDKTSALANIFRKYGIKVYLTARFSAPMELGGLKTADPLDPQVRLWWKNKIDEIYQKIPDFGGFLVKANSEGQPGPQDYKRNHADGANMLAEPLKKYGGIVMWRAFVYSHEVNEDRYKQAYKEFVPLDGQFAENVLVQVKNGPIDFQPREPFHPMFGAMPKTPLMLELQITKEYLGQGTHLVGLAKMYEEVLQSDAYVKGKGTTVAKIIDGTTHDYNITGIAGVANIGTAFNWTGNLFGQADWYAFGKLAWNPYLDASNIFKEWTAATFPNHDKKVADVSNYLLEHSHEACVNYMTPLGLHHIMAEDHHFGPGPWVDSLFRADWTSVYYHKANKDSIGFDRKITGTNALSQYHPEVQKFYGNLSTCPDEFLLWFHRVPWTHQLKSGRNVWQELVFRYDQGVSKVIEMKSKWDSVEGLVDKETFRSVRDHLNIQSKEAQWWRDACLAYFQSRSQLPYPIGTIPPPHGVDYYKSLSYPYSPGINPKW
jgi:alpha-glucuronidase